MILRGLSSATKWHIPGIKKRKVSGVLVGEPEIGHGNQDHETSSNRERLERFTT